MWSAPWFPMQRSKPIAKKVSRNPSQLQDQCSGAHGQKNKDDSHSRQSTPMPMLSSHRINDLRASGLSAQLGSGSRNIGRLLRPPGAASRSPEYVIPHGVLELASV